MSNRTTSLFKILALGVASATVVSLAAFGVAPPARADSVALEATAPADADSAAFEATAPARVDSADARFEALSCEDPPCGLFNPCTCTSAVSCGGLQGDCVGCDWVFVCNEDDATGACIDGYCTPQ